MIKITLVFTVILIFLPTLYAQDPPGELTYQGAVSLAWDPSVSEGVTGYYVYYGLSSGNYEAPIDAGDVTIFTVENLAPGTYYFAVTAYDAEENQSGFSNEVSALVPESGQHFFVIGPLPIDITGTTIKLAWKTSVPCTTRIEFTYQSGTFSSLVVDTVAVTDHFVRLTELQPRTLYNYEVFNTDTEGNLAVASGTFRTR